MLRKFSTYFLAIAIILTGSLAIFAQSAPVRGKVELKKGDGTMEPVEGAVVEVYRTDIKAKLPSSKTDKKGQFVFAGLPLGATMTFVVSGKGLKPELLPGVKAGQEDLKITVTAGDGSILTEDQVRSAVNTTPVSQTGEAPKETEDQKKAREEAQKKYDEAVAKNKKIEEANTIVKRAGEEGVKAFQEKNYDLAIAKFDEGINADPDFVPNVTLFSNNKAAALQRRAIDGYNLGIKDTANKASLHEKSKEDFLASIVASQKTLDLIAKVTDPIEAGKYAQNKSKALFNLLESRRLLFATSLDISQPNELVSALEAYLQVETDAAAKLKAQVGVGDGLRSTGNSALAVPIYRKVLETDPSHVEATGGLGLSLFDVGVSNTNKEQMQEGLNIMQKFTELAPDTHPLKASTKDAVAYLKDVEKLMPQKTTTPAKGPAKGKKP